MISIKKEQLKQTADLVTNLKESKPNGNNSFNIQFYVFSNTASKTKTLGIKFLEMGYSIEYDIQNETDILYVIIAKTDQITLSKDNLNNWTDEMFEISFKYDCQFDGWKLV